MAGETARRPLRALSLAAWLLLAPGRPDGADSEPGWEPRVPDPEECRGYREKHSAALARVLREAGAASKDPAWAKARGLDPSEWSGLAAVERPRRLYALLSEQSCRLKDEFFAYGEWLRAVEAIDRAAACRLTDPQFEALRRGWRLVRHMERRFQTKFPLGLALARDPEAEAYLARELGALPERAGAQSARWAMAREQCDTAQRGLKAALAESRARVDGAAAPLRGPLDGAALDRAFENARPRPGEAAPREDFASLTRGLEFHGVVSAQGPGGEELNRRAREVYGRALEQAAGTEEGRRVLRDLQAFLDRREAEHRAQAAPPAKPDAGPVDRAAAANPRPFVAVEFAPLPPGVGGFAAGLESVWEDAPGARGLSFRYAVKLSEDLLLDPNPPRAANPILAHELRHIADGDLFGGGPWQITEDRGNMTGMRVLLEQSPVPGAEPESPRALGLCRGDAAPVLADPTRAREHFLDRSAYLFRVTPDDLEGWDGARDGLRGRLARAYRALRDAPSAEARSALIGQYELFAHLPLGLAEAWAEREAFLAGPRAFEEEAEGRFIRSVQGSRGARRWLARVDAARRALGGPDGARLRGRLEAAERAYWRDALALHERHRGAGCEAP